MPGEEGYVFTDALHTPVCVADREGRLQNTYRYSEYGELEEYREVTKNVVRYFSTNSAV